MILKLPRSLNYFPIIVLLFLLVLPTFVNSPRYLSLLDIGFIDIVLALGMFSLWSVGLFNAAQPAFFGFGAYCVALLALRAHWPFWATLPTAGILSATIGVIIGYPGLKVKGTQFFILTLAFCELTTWIYTSWPKFFGGAVGLTPIPQPLIHIASFTIDFSRSLVPYYYLALLLAVITSLTYFRIHGSRLGRVWESIGKTEDLMSNTGTSVFTQKQICFVTSCFFAGLAGAIYAPYMTIVSPGEFTISQGMAIFLGVIVGGTATPIGPIVGTTFMAILSVLLQKYSEYEPLIWGPILILTLLFMPFGLIGLPRMIMEKAKELMGNRVAANKVGPTEIK
jgi:branched-chain amino acid transport system permease protein